LGSTLVCVAAVDAVESTEKVGDVGVAERNEDAGDVGLGEDSPSAEVDRRGLIVMV
jgi:hypothetical protein